MWGGGQWREPQLSTSTLALRHLCPWLGAAAELARFSPGPAGHLVLQGAQVPTADGPGPGPQGLSDAGLLPQTLGLRRSAPGMVMLKRVGPGCCSWHPAKRAHWRFPVCRVVRTAPLWWVVGVLDANHRGAVIPKCLALKGSH